MQELLPTTRRYIAYDRWLLENIRHKQQAEDQGTQEEVVGKLNELSKLYKCMIMFAQQIKYIYKNIT